MRLGGIIADIGIGVAAGLLAAAIAILVSFALGFPVSATYTFAIVTGAVLGGLFSWSLRTRTLATSRWVAGGLFASGIALVLAAYLDIWEGIIWDARIVGIGFSLVSISIAGFALSVSRESGDRMKAMANLEFYEKIGVLEYHIENVKNGNSIVVGTVCNDIRGAMQLKNYVEPTVKQRLDDKIQELIEVALGGQPYAELVRQLQQLQRDDC